MTLDARWINFAGPALIAIIAVGVVVTGAYSTSEPSASPATAVQPEPLPDEVRLGAIATGPVVDGDNALATDQSGVEMSPIGDVASTPLNAAGYKWYLEVGSYSTRSAAEYYASTMRRGSDRDDRMGNVFVYYAKDAVIDPYRVHIGPFASDVTYADVETFRTQLKRPDAAIVSQVAKPKAVATE